MSLRVVFMGTPDFALPALEALYKNFDLALVVSRPDAVRGRGKIPVPSAVKLRAQELQLPVLEAKTIDESTVEVLRHLQPDLIVVAAYGAILPDEILGTRLARFGCINVHASLLPKWRGAAPIQRAILEKDPVFGVSIMQMHHELDAGPWCRQGSFKNTGQDFFELTRELSLLGARELISAINDIEQGAALWHEQNLDEVCYATKVSKQEMLLSPAQTAEKAVLRVRASSDTAPARAVLVGRDVRITKARLLTKEEMQSSALASLSSLSPAEVCIVAGRIFLKAADTVFEVLLLKPAGKQEMTARQWAAGARGEMYWGSCHNYDRGK